MNRSGLLMAALLSWASLPVYSAELQDFIDAGDYRGAYELGLRQAPLREGELGFDFLFALAALETGHPFEALFALERVVSRSPANHRARLELARALFMTGDYSSAREQFLMVRDTLPPENVRLRIESFLDRIAIKQRGRRFHFNGDLNMSGGADDNINSATANTEILVPALGIVQLGDESIRQQDAFTDLSGNLLISKPLNKLDKVVTGFSAHQRNNLNSDAFDTLNLGVQVAYQGERKEFHFKVPYRFNTLDVADTRIRNSNTLGLELMVTSIPRLSPQYYIQAGNMNYASQDERDALFFVTGTGISAGLSGSTNLSLSTYFGGESITGAAKHFGRRYFGARAGVNHALRKDQQAYVNLSWQSSGYRARYPAFGITRSDEFFQTTTGWRWNARRHLALRTELQYFINRSNIDLFDYDRIQIMARIESRI